MRLLVVLVAALCLIACATSTPESDTTVAQIADLAVAKGRLEAELAAANRRAVKERAARIEADVKLAAKAFELALAAYNSEMMATVCDVKSGAIDGPTADARLKKAAALTDPFYEGCATDEPANKCVERKARAEAEKVSP